MLTVVRPYILVSPNPSLFYHPIRFTNSLGHDGELSRSCYDCSGILCVPISVSLIVLQSN